MKAQIIDIRKSTGRILCCTIFRAGGKKLLAKGHTITDDDARLLESEGMKEVWVTELEDWEVSEDDAVMRTAREIGCGSLEIRLAPGGRANLFATEASCLLVDDELLKQINCLGSIVMATLPNLSYAHAGQRVATVKSTPFAAPAHELEAIISIVQDRGPILQGRPIRSPNVAVLYTDPISGERARELFADIMRQRLARLGTTANLVLACVEKDESVTRSLQHLLQGKPSLVLIASTTAPAGPFDTIGRAMLQVDCQIERFLAPVEPGNLLLLGYKDDIPMLSAPSCFRSSKPNVLDVMLPPLLARYRISGWEIGTLGNGGLLT